MDTRRKRPLRLSSGFSLIELVVVIAIILIIASFAIPRFLKSRMMASETGAAAGCRAIATAEVSYENTYRQGYSPSLASLGPGTPATAANADLVDALLASGVKAGYTYTYVPIDINGDGKPDQFTVNANPVTPGVTGDRYFYVDQTMVIRYNVGAPASAASPPIPQ